MPLLLWFVQSLPDHNVPLFDNKTNRRNNRALCSKTTSVNHLLIRFYSFRCFFIVVFSAKVWDITRYNYLNAKNWALLLSEICTFENVQIELDYDLKAKYPSRYNSFLPLTYLNNWGCTNIKQSWITLNTMALRKLQANIFRRTFRSEALFRFFSVLFSFSLSTSSGSISLYVTGSSLTGNTFSLQLRVTTCVAGVTLAHGQLSGPYRPYGWFHNRVFVVSTLYRGYQPLTPTQRGSSCM